MAEAAVGGACPHAVVWAVGAEAVAVSHPAVAAGSRLAVAAVEDVEVEAAVGEAAAVWVAARR